MVIGKDNGALVREADPEDPLSGSWTMIDRQNSEFHDDEVLSLAMDANILARQ